MPASVVPISGRRQGTFVVLEAAVPGQPVRPIGVVLADLENNRAWLRFREQFDFADPDDAEVLEGMEGHLRQLLDESGPAACLASLTDSLSNAIRISDPQAVAVDAFTRVLDQLYRKNIENTPISSQTHVGLYTLRSAAGGLGEEMIVEPEDYIPLPAGIRPDPNLFCAHVVGLSMEPRIRDGSVNLFRRNPAGSRQGKILLIQRFGSTDASAQFTVKRYTSRKVFEGDQWRHTQVRLEPLNPEFEAWDLEPEDFAVVAEWICEIE